MTTCVWDDGKPCGYWYQGRYNAAEKFVCPQKKAKEKEARTLTKTVAKVMGKTKR